MHGIIFAELKKFVEARLGADAWEKLLSAAGMEGRIFMPIQEYPDADAVKLVTTAAQVTGLEADAILQQFGEFIAPDLLKMYDSLLQREWRTLDVIHHTEETIHRVVRARNPGAAPPYLKTERPSPDEVVVHYTSARRMCGVAKGIIRGMAKHYGEAISLSEPVCMLKGGAECRIIARRTPAKTPVIAP